MVLFEELNYFLSSLRARIDSSVVLGSASQTIAIAILAVLIDVTARATKLLSRRPWLGRIGTPPTDIFHIVVSIDRWSISAIYGKVLIKDAVIHDALRRLRTLTTLEMRAIAAESLIMAANVQNTASEVLTNTMDNRGLTAQVLEELQTLCQGVSLSYYFCTYR